MARKRKTPGARKASPSKRTKKVIAAGAAGVNGVEPETLGVWAAEFIGVETVPEDPGCGLLNSIHPLFGCQNFPGVFWAPLQRPARLATKMLGAAVLKPLLRTALRGQPTHLQRTYGRNRKYVYAAATIATPVTRAAILDVEQALIDLAPMIRFQISDTVDSWATTPDLTWATPGHRHFSNGVGSRIRHARSLYDALGDAASTEVIGRNALDWPQLRLLEFDFAVVMVHEVFHAFFNARLGSANWEPFFGNATIAETGFEAESRLFGGHICPLYNEPDDAQHEIHPYRFLGHPDEGQGPLSAARGIMVMWEWPERGVVDAYTDQQTIDCHRSLLPKLDLAWRLPLSYFAQVFTTAF
ncbi:hypothetical protein LTR85_011738 [Meristemomyces frigidus]|nr:hypothetical protein LTR85_011738 [Meristemomyces frigidus]